MRRSIGVILVIPALVLMAIGCGGSGSKRHSLTPEKSDLPTATEEESGAKDGSASSASMGALGITSIERDGENATVTLNGAVSVSGVKVMGGSSGEFLAFPRRGRFDYVKLSRDLGDRVLKQFKNDAPDPDVQGFQITGTTVRVLENSSGKTVAFVEFELNGGALKLYSWPLINGSNGLFMGSPREKVGDDWVDIVKITDGKLKDEMFEAALKSYAEEGGDISKVSRGFPKGEDTGEPAFDEGGSGRVSVSQIDADGGTYSIVLNGQIRVVNVEIKKEAGSEYLAFPQRDGGSKMWDYVRISRAAADKLLEQVKTGTPSDENSDFEISSVKVVKMKSTRGKTRAYAEFNLNDGAVTLYSWPLIESNEGGVFLGSPRYKTGDDWKDLVKVLSSGLKEKMSAAAIEEYDKQK